jgi:hypothetical protein
MRSTSVQSLLSLFAVLTILSFMIKPAWPIMNSSNGGLNLLALAVGVLACYDVMTRPTLAVGSPSTLSTQSKGSALLATLGIGGLFFVTHTLFTDSGTIITYAWSGYPLKGPTPLPAGALVIIAVALGLVLSRYHWLTSHPLWFIAGCVSMWVLYARQDWQGFWGGISFAIFAFSSLPSYVRSAARHSPACVFGGGFLVYNLLLLAHVWTVAYAFVPGGEYLRERTDIVLVAAMAAIGAGFWNVYRLGDVNSAVQQHSSAFIRRARAQAMLAFAGLSALGVAISLRRLQVAVVPVPFHPEARLFTAGIWTVHFGVDNMMWDSQRRMRDLFRDAELDVIGWFSSQCPFLVPGFF